VVAKGAELGEEPTEGDTGTLISVVGAGVKNESCERRRKGNRVWDDRGYSREKNLVRTGGKS